MILGGAKKIRTWRSTGEGNTGRDVEGRRGSAGLALVSQQWWGVGPSVTSVLCHSCSSSPSTLPTCALCAVRPSSNSTSSKWSSLRTPALPQCPLLWDFGTHLVSLLMGLFSLGCQRVEIFALDLHCLTVFGQPQPSCENLREFTHPSHTS